MMSWKSRNCLTGLGCLALGMFTTCVRAQELRPHAQNTAQPTVAIPAPPSDGTPPTTPAPTTAPAQPQGPAGVANRPATMVRDHEGRESAATEGLAAISLFAVNPPRPRSYAKHDLVEIIINENSVMNFQSTHDLKKSFSDDVELAKFPSLRDLFTKLALRDGTGAGVNPGLTLTNNDKYKGEATANRTDQVTAKITATVIDVKPNGNLVLEAKESIQSDRETSTMVLSGECRTEDITKSNTIQSSQLSNMNLHVDHSGDVRNTAEKGFITRIIEGIFNF